MVFPNKLINKAAPSTVSPTTGTRSIALGTRPTAPGTRTNQPSSPPTENTTHNIEVVNAKVLLDHAKQILTHLNTSSSDKLLIEVEVEILEKLLEQSEDPDVISEVKVHEDLLKNYLNNVETTVTPSTRPQAPSETSTRQSATQESSNITSTQQASSTRSSTTQASSTQSHSTQPTTIQPSTPPPTTTTQDPEVVQAKATLDRAKQVLQHLSIMSPWKLLIETEVEILRNLLNQYEELGVGELVSQIRIHEDILNGYLKNVEN